jgi:hypothetical protein
MVNVPVAPSSFRYLLRQVSDPVERDFLIRAISTTCRSNSFVKRVFVPPLLRHLSREETEQRNGNQPLPADVAAACMAILSILGSMSTEVRRL